MLGLIQFAVGIQYISEDKMEDKMMEPKPVQRSRQPAYPTRREVLAGAASFALVGLTGINFVFADAESGEIAVAPIFAHGEGRGATGCIVVSPPVFLSEEEGMQILREELAKNKIELKAGQKLAGVGVPSKLKVIKEGDKNKDQTADKKWIIESSERAKPLKLSGMDSQRKIAVEFVSKDNQSSFFVDDFFVDDLHTFSSVQRYDFKTLAEQVNTLAAKQGKERVFLGVFYDPLSSFSQRGKSDEGEKEDWETSWKRKEKTAKEESKKLLREQAQDFVVWLKEQKAID